MRLSDLIRRKKRQRKKQIRHIRRRNLLEQLEPRPLLTADLPGDDLSSAHAVGLTSGEPQTLNEQIGDGLYSDSDVDLFEISLTAGQTLTADIDAYYLDDGSNLSNLDSYLRIFDSSGPELTTVPQAPTTTRATTATTTTMPIFRFSHPQRDTYYVAVSGEYNTYYDPTTAGSGSSGSTGAYELTLLAESNDPDVPGDQLSEAQMLNLTPGVPQTVNEQIGNGQYGDRDVDLYEVSLTAGQTLKADIDAYYLDDGSNLSNLDSYLRVFDSSGTELDYNDSASSSDDYAGYYNYDAYLSSLASVTGTYYVAVSGEYNTSYDSTTAGSGSSGSTGAYELTLLAESNDPDVPGDELSEAQTLNLTPGVPQTVNEEVGNGQYGDRDVDLYEVSLTAGQTLKADIDAYYLDDVSNLSNLGSYLRVFDSTGRSWRPTTMQQAMTITAATTTTTPFCPLRPRPRARIT